MAWRKEADLAYGIDQLSDGARVEVIGCRDDSNFWAEVGLPGDSLEIFDDATESRAIFGDFLASINEGYGAFNLR